MICTCARSLSVTAATTICVVTMDLLGLDAGLLERVRSAVEQQTGLARERLMLTASHNHSAPLTIPYDVTVQPRRDRDWEAQLVERTADTVAQALTAMLPVSLAAGRADVQVGLNRRLSTLTGTTMAPNPAGPVAPWVDILRVDRSGDAPLALLFSHAAHPVTVHSTATEFTADYPGAAAATIRDALGAGVTPLFAQGCAADINVEPLRGGFAEAERAGTLLGQAAVAAASGASATTGGTIRVATETIHLDFELMSADVCRAVMQRLQESYSTLQAGGADDRTLDQQKNALAWAQKMLEYARERAASGRIAVSGTGLCAGPGSGAGRALPRAVCRVPALPAAGVTLSAHHGVWLYQRLRELRSDRGRLLPGGLRSVRRTTAVRRPTPATGLRAKGQADLSAGPVGALAPGGIRPRPPMS